VQRAQEQYRLNEALQTIYQFAWDSYCSWYLELAKAQLADEGTAEGTRAVLGHVLDALLRLLHPMIPFVTEALWQALTGGESVVVAAWPTEPGAPVDTAAAQRVEDLQRLVTEIRRFRSEQRVPDNRRVAAKLVGLDEAGLGRHRSAIAGLVRLTQPGAEFAATATLEVALAGGGVHVEIDTSGAIDVAAERARLGRDLAAAETELAQAEKKLGNEAFIGKAPAEIVDGIRARHATATADIERITARLAALPS
jgi:valyl-tRNA synthetase